MSPQASIGHYKIVSKLGEGGMGAVYRATDTKLNRDVAIKVLPDSVADDTDRLARFTREAQVLASLNHPNIAHIYGVEDRALVLELVEGEELKGPLPVDTAIAYAKQLAAALEAAHEKGIIHRDLKPANIKITPEGIVKVLDFGLAKAAEDSPARTAASPTISPTLSLEMTQAGMILGTAAYMSPEQAAGKAVDKRADIWSFGVVLYEMLAGKRLFDGETISHTLADVLRAPIDLATLPAATPPHVRALLGRCLDRDVRTRLRDIGEARVAIGQAATAAPEPASTPTRPGRLPSILAAAALVLAAAGWGLFLLRPQPPAPGSIRFPLTAPDLAIGGANAAVPDVVPSPDGRSIVFVASAPGATPMLWLRSMNSTDVRRLDRTEGADLPFWSPDSQSIGFFADDKLKVIPAAGGTVTSLCDVTRAGAAPGALGATWGPDGSIIFSPGPGVPLLRVSSSGGRAVPATALDVAGGEAAQAWPQFLADGRHVLYISGNMDANKTGIYVQELGSSKRNLVLRTASRAAWAPPGYLIYMRDTSLFAQRMEPGSWQLTGEPALIEDAVPVNPLRAAAGFSVSPSGTLVYRFGSTATVGQLTWFGRDGTRLGSLGKPAPFLALDLSPDEKYVALSSGTAAENDISLMEISSGILTKLTSDGRAAINPIVWSSDSRRIAISRSRPPDVVELTVASGATRTLYPSILWVTSWSQDGSFVIGTDGAGHLVRIPADGTGKAEKIDISPAWVNFRLSPDAKYVAYQSNQSNPAQVFVASFPSFSEKRQISKDGGANPQWRRDGKELFFRTREGTLLSTDIQLGTPIQTSAPKPLFQFSAAANGQQYTPSPDGKRFLVKEISRTALDQRYIIVTNWQSELKK